MALYLHQVLLSGFFRQRAAANTFVHDQTCHNIACHIQGGSAHIENSVQVLVLVGSGFSLTSLMQSSSAAESGLLPLKAAALVIGANLGTTTTAILTVFGATPTAKRVALAHVFFNVITTLIAILILGPMLAFGSLIQASFGLDTSPAVSLALFHTCFNILGVLLMYPPVPAIPGRSGNRIQATLSGQERARPALYCSGCIEPGTQSYCQDEYQPLQQCLQDKAQELSLEGDSGKINTAN